MEAEKLKKILVVDDEPHVRQLVKRLLSNEYTVLEAENGVEALEMVRSQKPDLVLMDIMMPKLDGLSACSEIKHDLSIRHIPVIMLTAITHDLNRRLSEKVIGANGYITKPFDVIDLLPKIKELLEKVPIVP